MTARLLTSNDNPNAPAESFDLRAPRRQEADAFPVQPYSAIVILGVWLCGAALPLAIVFKLAGILQTLALLSLLAGLVTCITSPRREC